MIRAFERRMVALAVVVVGLGFLAVVVGLLLFASSLYVGTLMRDESDVLSDARAVLLSGGSPSDARRGADLLAQRFFRPRMRITVLDGRHRVQIFRSPGTTTPTIAEQDVAADPSTDYLPSSLVGRLTMASATLAGLHALRASIGPLLVVARVDPPALVADFWRVAPLLGAALLIAIALAYVLARLVVHEALRPLADVASALERFAAGDLTPRAIIGHESHQLGSLTKAYNDAIAQLQAAFGERDRAHAAMRQFISDAAHQLRTPLTVVRGFIGVLQHGDLRAPSDRERILATMNNQCLLMGSMVEKLIILDRWEQPGAGPAEPIDVAQLVSDVVAPIAESVPEREVRLQVAPRSALARIDPSDCSYALTNLLENALKYAAEGPIDVALDADAERIRVTVSDRGPGMTPEEAEHAFDRFYRGALHRDVAGSGLGLAIARRAVERARGSLTLETAPGRGSRFTIDLPRHPQPLAPVGTNGVGAEHRP